MHDLAQDLAQRVALGLAYPWQLVAGDAESKLWWPSVLASLVLAWVAVGGARSWRRFRTLMLDAATWTSVSARNDIWILLLNPLLQATILAAFVVDFRGLGSWVADMLRGLGVHGEAHDAAAVAWGLALTAALFLVDDLARWLTHYLQHRIPALWEFHKVHHSAEVLGFLTVQRHHPVDPLLTTAAIGIGVAVVNGVFIALAGDHLTLWTLAGANVFRVVANALGGVLRHSPFWVGFGPVVERWIVSPAMHHIHHSGDPRHYDSNFGTSLSVWDRMAGTLLLSRGERVERFGIGEETAEFRTLRAIYLRPIVSAWRMLASRRQASSVQG